MDGIKLSSPLAVGIAPASSGSHGGKYPPDPVAFPINTAPMVGPLATGNHADKPNTPNRRHRISGCLEWSYRYDFYDRVHINPAFLDLGNLLSEQSREVRVWNAFTDPKTLSSIGEASTDGLTMTSPRPIPTVVKALEELLFDVSISTDGPPVMDATYTFNFNGGVTVSLNIVGKRVVVWPFMPQVRFTESLEWLTDVLKTRSQEQRLALRQVPRQTFEYDYQLDDWDFARAKQIATGWVQRVYGVPAWGELSHIGGIAGNPQSLTFDTRWADWRVGGIALVYEAADKFEACEIVAIADDRLDFKIPIAQNFTNAFIVPLRFGRAPSGFTFSRTNVGVTKSTGSFEIVDSVDLGATILPEYDGYPVMLDRPLQDGSMNEKITRDTNVFDPKVGDMAVDSVESYARQTATAAWGPLTREDLWRVRQLLHTQRGRQKAFLMPTWNNDLQVQGNIGAASTSVRVKEIMYHLYFKPAYVMFHKRNGDTFYAKTISSTGNGDGSETIELSEPLGFDATLEELDTVCFMPMMRFNSDRVEIQYDAGGTVAIAVPLIEVPFYNE